MSYRARPPSPSNTNFSGISNYRSESYRPIRDREVPAVPQIDSKKVARVHFDELSLFLSSHLARGQCQSLVEGTLGNQTLTFLYSISELPNSRVGAREKLTRLTRQQFQELSTDVYDELIRRDTRSESRSSHPKRATKNFHL
jgi:protein SPA2